MLTPFKSLSDSARVLIYQAKRSLTDEEQQGLHEKLTQFGRELTQKQPKLQVGFVFRYQRFVIFGFSWKAPQEERESSSIVREMAALMQECDAQYQVNFLDTMNVTFRQGKYLAYKELKDFKKMVKARSVSPKTIVFNNMVNTKIEFEECWETPLKDSWHQRFLIANK